MNLAFNKEIDLMAKNFTRLERLESEVCSDVDIRESTQALLDEILKSLPDEMRVMIEDNKDDYKSD